MEKQAKTQAGRKAPPVTEAPASQAAAPHDSFLDRGFGKPDDVDGGLAACIRLCWTARTICQKTFVEHCLPMGGKHVAPAHVIAMTDCIETLQLAADLMTRGSPSHTAVCSAAAIVADACADSCEALQPSDVTPDGEMQRCADACRACAIACRDMAAKGVAPEDMHIDAPPSLAEEFPSINA